MDANSLNMKVKEDKFDAKIPEGGFHSGLYHLFTKHELPSNHLDHPKTRLKNEKLDRLIDWKIDIKWYSSYKELSYFKKEPVFTTLVPWFNGCIDYILATKATKAITYLEMPWQRSFNYHLKENNNDEIKEDSNMNQDIDILYEKECEKAFEMFKQGLPDVNNPSDHLPLCCDFVIL